MRWGHAALLPLGRERGHVSRSLTPDFFFVVSDAGGIGPRLPDGKCGGFDAAGARGATGGGLPVSGEAPASKVAAEQGELVGGYPPGKIG
jgi:hypothetical protein